MRSRPGTWRSLGLAPGMGAGLAAALLFGLSAPLVSIFVGDLGTSSSAGLLYGGAAVALTAFRRGRPGATREAPIRRSDWPALGAVTVLGGMVGPLLLIVGLQRLPADSASLLLNLEAVATMVLAAVIFGEHLGRRGVAAAVLVVAGGVVLAGPRDHRLDPVGVLAIAGACLAWGVDNNLSQRLSIRDPIRIAQIKAAGASVPMLVLAVLLGENFGGTGPVLALLAIGAVGYGASIALDLVALRLLGAAREATVFASAPFAGAIFALLFLDGQLTLDFAVAGALMVGGVVLLIGENHSHLHQHEPVQHEHRHTHDEHHAHEHDVDAGSGEEHSHVHAHEPIVHRHPHVPDLHHRHRH
jgi:drug/metabolite transporter (DMT)-like permease